MLTSPTHAIIGTTNIDRAATFLAAFGYSDRRDDVVSREAAAALYGLDNATRQATVRMPLGGDGPGWIRLVETPLGPHHAGPYDYGPHAIDLYTRDIEQSVAAARAAGAACGPIVHYPVGPLQIGEAKVVGPDHLVVVFIQVDRRRPSLLDHPSAPLHSELHSAVWTVPAIDPVKAFWTEHAGLPQLLDATIASPEVAKFMGLSREDAPIRLLVMADRAQAPARVELLEFPEDPGAQAPADRPMRAGLYALGFTADDVEAAMAALHPVAWGATTDASVDGRRHRAVSGVAPGGVRIELWART